MIRAFGKTQLRNMHILGPSHIPNEAWTNRLGMFLIVYLLLTTSCAFVPRWLPGKASGGNMAIETCKLKQ